MKSPVAVGLATVAMAALPTLAQAQEAYAAKDVHLRAGPARDYPVVAVVPAGAPLTVQGCLSDYSWCDVIAGPTRGWVYAANIEYAYQGGYAPVLGYGAEIGIAIVGFALLDYWNHYYIDRPFYRDRDQWVHRPRPPRAAPPGARPELPRQGSPRMPQPQPEPPHRDLPGGPHPQPPHRDLPGGPHPQPPHRDLPGGPHPQPPQQGSPGEPRQQPPQHGAPGAAHPQAPEHRAPGGQRPASPQRDDRDRPNPR